MKRLLSEPGFPMLLNGAQPQDRGPNACNLTAWPTATIGADVPRLDTCIPCR